jgi:hypothetical protein
MKVRTLCSRRPSGAITPKNYWRLYAENAVAPLRRKSGGAITPKTKWLLYAENSQADRNIRNRAVSHTGRHDERECIVAIVGRPIDVRNDLVGRNIGAFDDTKPLGFGRGPEREFGATTKKAGVVQKALFLGDTGERNHSAF